MDLITGATGFIGRHVAQYLGNSGRSCRLLARNLQPDEGVYLADLNDTNALHSSCVGIDRVFH